MIGYHAVPVIADAYMKGIKGFDAEAALKAMVASATYAPYAGLGEYMARGYVPIDEPEAASKTVEYAFDDWTIARMASAMGKADIAATFDKRAGYWRNSFDTASGWLRAQERWHVPHALRSRRHQLWLGLYRGQRLAIQLVRTAGSGGPVQGAGGRCQNHRQAGRDVRLRHQQARLQPRRGYCGPDRPIHSWQ
jgi:putative alpha-1,2-mannosidase